MYQILEFYLKSSHPDLKKAKISEVIAEADIKVIQGGDEELNLLYSLSNIAKAIKSK
jgi:hypothetical protein